MMHLMLDIHTGDRDALSSESIIYSLLDRLPDVIHMTKITQPVVVRYSGVNPDDWGVSGFVMIAESHISIRTFVERGLANVDIFSCKEFDWNKAEEFVCGSIKPVYLHSKLIERGLDSIE